MAKIKRLVAGKMDIVLPLICSFFLLAIALAFGREATPEQRAYMRGRVQLVSRDTQTIPGSVINVYRRGRETWSETNLLTVVNTAVRYRVSKLKLIVNLKDMGKWVVVKDFITAQDMKDEWDACQFIDVRYPAFVTATNAAVRAGMATSEDISKVLEKSWDD